MENPTHRAVVESGGGIYVPGMLFDIVMFTSPYSGSTLGLHAGDLTSDKVRDEIAKSDLVFSKCLPVGDI